MHTLYISYDGMTDPLGQSQVIPYLIGLAKRGHRITLISCEKGDKFKKLSQTIQILLDKHSICWIPVPYSTLPSVLAKQLNLLRIKQQAISLCKNNKIEVVHCRSYMAALIGLQLKQKFGCKFIFDMRGFWADERIDGGIWSLKNKLQNQLYKYFKKKEIEFLRTADYTISLTENAKNEILNWKEFSSKKIPIQVIPCCADLELFSQKNIELKKQSELKQALHITESDFVISYLGSIGTWYMLYEMLDFFKCLLTIKPNSKFLWITPDNKDEIIIQAIALGISKEQLLIHSATRNEVPLYLSLSQVSLYFIKPLYSKKASSPTKTAEIMGMGIPIITNTGIGDSDKIISESNAGHLIKNFTEQEYVRAINQIDVLLTIDKLKIVESANNYFSLDKGVELYQSVYKTLADVKK